MTPITKNNDAKSTKDKGAGRVARGRVAKGEVISRLVEVD